LQNTFEPHDVDEAAIFPQPAQHFIEEAGFMAAKSAGEQ
jgi:hypothetical protein